MYEKPESPWFEPKAAADYLGLAVGTLGKWRLHPKSGGPPFYRMPGGPVRYKRADLDAWLSALAGAPLRESQRRPNAGRPAGAAR